MGSCFCAQQYVTTQGLPHSQSQGGSTAQSITNYQGYQQGQCLVKKLNNYMWYCNNNVGQY